MKISKYTRVLKSKKFIFLIPIFLIITALSCYLYKTTKPIIPPSPISFGEKIDDWQFKPENLKDKVNNVVGSATKSLSGFGVKTNMEMAAPVAVSMAGDVGSKNIGLAVGGAKDVNNFRENIKNNYLPLSTDISYEGLFYDYFFDTGESQECVELFCPSYSYGLTRDPFSKDEQYYLAVGLNSGIKENDFSRKKLNLVIVLDISGSMGSSFNNYYYDQTGNRLEKENTDKDEDFEKSKMEVANKSVAALLDHLNDDDRFGMVLFDDDAYLAKSLRYVGETKMEEIKKHILDIKDKGGTNMESGMKEATSLFDDLKNIDQSEYENRIIFITDAMPNRGKTSKNSLLDMTQDNAKDKISTTFIGVGVDFNTDLIESITKIRGANYYSVHSSTQFKQRMDDEFEYMVTPLVFDLQLQLDAKGWDIEKVYGSPEANESTGDIMKVNTLFPSKKEDGETKGGLVLLKLKKKSDNTYLRLKVSYEDRDGNKKGGEVNAKILNQSPEFFDNSGVRKGILLARYADLMKNWINDERVNYIKLKDPIDKPTFYEPSINKDVGIIIPKPIEKLGQWERQSVPLRVSDDYKKLFAEFENYFQNEKNAIGDDSLETELEVLRRLRE